MLKQRPPNGATRISVSLAGFICGAAGIQHGIGEILQGNIAANGPMINAWVPASPIFGEEPALTVIPNLLISGILAVIVSLLVMMWAVAFIQRRLGGAIFLFLSIAQFLVGGGFAQIFLAIVTGIAAFAINSPLTWLRKHQLQSAKRAFAVMWVFFLCAFSFLFSSLLLSRLIYGNNAELAYGLGILTLGLMFATFFAGLAYDAHKQ